MTMDDQMTHREVQIRAMRDLARTLPKNDMGLPTGIYRSDMLPYHDYVPPVGETPINGLPVPALADQHQRPTVAVNTDPTQEDDDGEWEELEDDEFEEYLNGEEVLTGARTGKDPEELGLELPDQTPPDLAPSLAPELAPEHALAPVVHRTAGFPSRDLEPAFVWLNYDEGFPTLPGGTPFWGRLDFEPADAFSAFQQYLYMSFGRAPNPEEEGDYGGAAQGARSIAELALMLTPSQSSPEFHTMLQTVEEYYHLYYWAVRAQAYDLFRVAQHKQQMELRAIETQDDHYLLARKLRFRLMDYMDSEEEFWDMLTPKVAADLLKQITQLERVSAGLPAMGPLAEGKGGGEGRSFEVAFRRVAQANQGGALIEHDPSGGEDALRTALEDPESTRVLQELIIKVG